MKAKIDIDLSELAIDLAAAGDDEQAIFFNKFFEALKVCCGNEYRYGMQLVNIAALLKSHSVDGMIYIVGDKAAK